MDEYWYTLYQESIGTDSYFTVACLRLVGVIRARHGRRNAVAVPPFALEFVTVWPFASARVANGGQRFEITLDSGFGSATHVA